MSVFDDFNRFLEERLDEFLRNNPHLELQALEEQLKEQEAGARRLVNDLKAQEKTLETQILETAREVQTWHIRIEKAKSAGRLDLVEPALEREAALLRQGNQLWGQMQGVKDRIQQTQTLQRQIQQRLQEVQAKAAAAKTAAPPKTETWSNPGWNRTTPYPKTGGVDPLEEKFQRWEMDDELEDLKRQMGR
jgi:uncharacterized protein (TIGR04376 family)